MSAPFEGLGRSRLGRGAVGDAIAFNDPGTGFRGWRRRLPEGRQAVTPCVDGGRLFIGGGFGSHAF